jgi:hypothetical protein
MSLPSNQNLSPGANTGAGSCQQLLSGDTGGSADASEYPRERISARANIRASEYPRERLE